MAGDRMGRRSLSNYWPAIAVAVGALTLEHMPAGIVLQGLIVGLVGALVAVGMALLYQSNRIVNFAQADLGVVPGVLAVSLAVYGGLSWFVAVPVGLVAAIALGCVVELVIIRRFRNAPRLVLMVATIGLAQLLAAASLFIPSWWHKTPATLQLHMPVELHFTVSPLVFSADHVLAAVVAPAILIALAAALRFTDIGIAVRASADRADRARLLGVGVDGLQTVVWATAAVLSFVGLILRTGILGLGVGPALSLDALLAALAALVLGGLTDIGAVTASAVSLGLLEAGVVWNHPRSPGLIAPVYAVVIVVCLLVRHSEPIRRVAADHISTWRLAEDARSLPASVASLRQVRAVRWLIAAAATGFLLFLPQLLGAGSREKATAVVVFAIVTISLVVLTGWAGQVSLGQMSFAAVGAVAGAHATQVWHADMAPALLFAGVVGVGVAVIVGLPALRVRGLFLAVTTLAFALTTSYLLVDKRFGWVPTSRVSRPTLFGGHVLDSQSGYYYLCLSVAVLAVLGLRGVHQSRTGRVLRATRENTSATQAFGVSAARAKLTAFALSGFLAAVAGCLLVHLLQSFAPATYAPDQSFVVFTAAVVGGLGSVLGGVLGAVFLKGGEWLLPSAQWQALTTAVGVLVVLWFVPGGLADLVYRVRDRLAKLFFGERETPQTVIDLRGGAGDVTVSQTLAAPAPPSTNRGQAFLSCRDLDVAYGPTQVLFGVDFDVGDGDIVALVGTNGAGKSTLAKAICGTARTKNGHVHFDGHELTGMSAKEIAALGVRLLPGGEGVFPSLTVAENLRIAGWLDRQRDPSALGLRTEQILRWFPVLRKRFHDIAGDLSGGEQQMLALGMVLVGNPRLLVIDEFDLGLAPTVVAQLLPILEGLCRRGMTIVLVEQSLTTAFTLAESAYFMEKGRIMFSGPTAELSERSDLLRAVFLSGADGAVIHGNGERPDISVEREPVLELTGLAVNFGGLRAVDDVSLRIADGEIVGVIGPNGAGKSTVFDLVSGFLRPTAGRVNMAGDDVSSLAPDQRARAGLGRTFQDARLFPALTVRDTIAVAQERSVAVRDPLRPALWLPSAFDAGEAVDERTQEIMELLNLTRYGDVLVRELSTGTKRVVELACALAHRPTVLLLDEPSTGLAQREAEGLQALLFVLREELDASILIIEHDTALLEAVADRIVAMDLGRVIADGRPAEVLHDPLVLTSYLGAPA